MSENITEAKEVSVHAELGAAVIVRGVVVAWFAVWDDGARGWCTENHFGEWLAWQAKAPELVRLSAAQLALIESEAEDMAKQFKESPYG